MISLRADCRSKPSVEIGFGSVVFVKTLKIDRTVYTRMLFALAEIPHQRFGFLFTHGNQSFRYVKRPIIGYFNLVIQSYAAKQRYLGLSRSMEGKDKIQTIGKIKRSFQQQQNFLEVKVCLPLGSKGPNKTMILVINQ